MILTTEKYMTQLAHWPSSGRHILAQFDRESVVVYQAYCPAIGRFAAENQHFGGPFKLDRMSWIKPNFLWMMYRCGWATKRDQEVVLAVRIRRDAFDHILSRAVPSSFEPGPHADIAAWKLDLQKSDVRLQWDPDHDPAGDPLPRRAIQLGLRGETLKKYAREWIVGIEDISAFVREQSPNVTDTNLSELIIPMEREYPVSPEITKRLGFIHVGH